MPYPWSAGTPDRRGKFYSTNESIFTTKYTGNLTGDPEQGYSVRDGVLAGYTISRFDWVKYRSVAFVYNGSRVGLLRSPSNGDDFPYLTRYPVENFVQVPVR